MPSNHLILCRPLLLLPSIFPSIKVFANESVLHIRWPKDWSFSFSIGPSNEYSGLISFRMDWLDLLAVQRTLKSLLQHHSSKASILRCSAFFTVQLILQLKKKEKERNIWAFMVAQQLRICRTIQETKETRVQTLGWEDLLEKEICDLYIFSSNLL